MNYEEQAPDRVLSETADLLGHEGFKILQFEHDKARDDLKKSILDVETPDKETAELKQQLRALEEQSPNRIIENIQRKTRKRISDFK